MKQLKPLTTILAAAAMLAALALLALAAATCFDHRLGNTCPSPQLFAGPVLSLAFGGVMLLRGSRLARALLALLFGLSALTFLTLAAGSYWTGAASADLIFSAAMGMILVAPSLLLLLSRRLGNEQRLLRLAISQRRT
jgi:hypothetical protein